MCVCVCVQCGKVQKRRKWVIAGKVRCCFGEIHFLHPSSTCPSHTHTLICTRTQTNAFVCPTQLKATARFAHAVLHTALCGLLHWVCVQWEPCLTAVKTTCLLCADINILILFCWAGADHTTTGCPGSRSAEKQSSSQLQHNNTRVMYLKVSFKPHPGKTNHTLDLFFYCKCFSLVAMRLGRANRDYLHFLPLTFFSSEEDISNLTYFFWRFRRDQQLRNSDFQYTKIWHQKLKYVKLK